MAIILLACGPCVVFINCWDMFCTLGRVPCTKETLPDFHEWCRVTQHPLVFRGLTGCQRDTPGLGHQRGSGRAPADPFCFSFLQRSPTSKDSGPTQQFHHSPAQFRLKKHHQFGAFCGNDGSFTNKVDLSVTGGINSEHKQDQQGDVDSRPPGGTPHTIQANTNEMEVLRLTNQPLLRELEQLTRQIQRPQETRQAREGRNTIIRGEEHLNPPREADGEGVTSQAKEHDPCIPPGENRNEERLGRDNKSDGLIQQEIGERSWE